jgi:hypothetical protein
MFFELDKLKFTIDLVFMLEDCKRGLGVRNSGKSFKV